MAKASECCALCLTYAADNVYVDYIDLVIGSQLFRGGMWRWRRGGRVEVMSPVRSASGIAGKIRLSWLSLFMVLRCRYRCPAARVGAVGDVV